MSQVKFTFMGALLVRLVVVGMTSVHRAGRPPNRDAVATVVPLVPAYPAAAVSSLSGRDGFALGLRAGGFFFVV
jgi:hypothetical protein